MAHLPTVRHYYAVYMAGRVLSSLPLHSSPPLHLSSTPSPPLLHSIFPSLLHHTTLLLSGDLLLLLSGELLSGELLSGKRTRQKNVQDPKTGTKFEIISCKKTSKKNEQKMGKKIAIQIQIQNSKIAMAHGGG